MNAIGDGLQINRRGITNRIDRFQRFNLLLQCLDPLCVDRRICRGINLGNGTALGYLFALCYRIALGTGWVIIDDRFLSDKIIVSKIRKYRKGTIVKIA